MKNKAIKLVFIIFILVIVIFFAIAGSIFFMLKPMQKNDDLKNDVRIEISYGTSINKVSKILKENNLVRNDRLFYYCARYPSLLKIFFKNEDINNTFVLKSGIYHLNDGMSVPEILNVLSSGQQEYVKVSIPEGFTISKIGELLQEKNICNAGDFVQVCKSSELCNKFNIPGENCEGYLFPDTYFLTTGMEAAEIASVMIRNFFEKIKSVPGLAEKNPEDLYYTVRLASIVEREYRLEDEAPLIASVFKNRLKYNIGLYSCATVVYIITEIQGRPHPDRVLISDTKIDNPYNTYLWAGLPPGAISNPGIVALNAATNTPVTDYYYFQVIDAEAGRHVFSKSFEDHVDNHNLYTKKVSGK